MVVLSALGRIFVRALIVVLIAGIAGATLVRFAPGFFSSEESLDHRLAPDTLAALKNERAAGSNPLRFFVDYSSNLLQGQAGRSIVYGRPVSELIRRRAPVTLATVGWGLAMGWTLAVLAATISALSRWSPVSYAFTFAGSSLAALPAVVLATFCVLFGLPPASAVAALVFPRSTHMPSRNSAPRRPHRTSWLPARGACASVEHFSSMSSPRRSGRSSRWPASPCRWRSAP